MSKKALISNIQNYSTKDGPGIRTTVFFTGCNLKCVWCSNPELIEPGIKVMYFENRCRRCGKCAETAVNNSIILTESGCEIDREKCTNIEECMEVCPYEAYEKSGYEISVQDLYNKLIRDKIFFEQSGGGVTFSGGEAGLQYEFLSEIGTELQKDNIHTALDTAGLITWEKLEKAINSMNMVLFDIKAYDSRLHRKYTGAGNELILENIKKTADKNKELIIRMVIVPGMNDNIEDIKKRISFIKELGSAVKQIDILKYHNLGEGKYKSLGMIYSVPKDLYREESFWKKVKEMASETGVKVTVDG
ncbi:4-hydroxyphenylacetate decarboxylase activating enzyme [Sebaldella termitidis]|uniref:Glycyl-radical enzyme activating protein family n=1 Tax=Sebaldella termitidis (strain ATCC 33386 / NCTC 11300) TaxID=526218 RepID=D1APR5_SEBTE|nr:glycyl-radical enzyme activating protein [Sebaldella termitidis]ACZ10099.1 glycyl-radical enzyme activating protein family [Sebaldella termitidis ATCC 33386]SUI25434.1 4-hydroxyphenylacetate decarboxylase activating enzyme [Sebaldella termitidis]